MIRLFAIMFFCLLLACQPTPTEEPIINQHTDGGEIRKMESTEEIPDRWEETVEQNSVTVIFDADVIAPDELSVTERSFEPRIFTQSEVDVIVDYFAQGRPLYVFPAVLTRKDYEQMYFDALKGTEVDGEYVMTEEAERYVKALQEKLLSAPDDGGKQYTDGKLTFDVNINGGDVSPGGENFLSVAIESGRHEDATLAIRNYVQGYQNATVVRYDKGAMLFTESLINGTNDNGEYVELSQEKRQQFQTMMDAIHVSLNDVETEATRVLQDLNLPAMRSVKTEKAVLFSYEGEWGVDSMRLPIAGWWVTFMRDYGVYSLLSDMQIYMDQRNREVADYSAPVSVEAIRMFFSDEGLEKLYYDGALREVPEQSRNVEMIAFSKMQNIARKHLYYQQAFTEGEADIIKEITIRSVELKLVYVRAQNSTSRLRLIPAWVLTGTCRHISNGTEIYSKPVSLVIGAETGGVILFGDITPVG